MNAALERLPELLIKVRELEEKIAFHPDMAAQ